MVITVELHMGRDGVGVVKLEDMVHVGREENEVLTVSPEMPGRIRVTEGGQRGQWAEAQGW